MFHSKHFNLRDMFISELHLSDGDVGQPNLVKTDQKFTARMLAKLEENAIRYLVRKWNDLQINVGGETVSAQVATAKKGPKTEGGCRPSLGKHGRDQRNRNSVSYKITKTRILTVVYFTKMISSATCFVDLNTFVAFCACLSNNYKDF